MLLAGSGEMMRTKNHENRKLIQAVRAILASKQENSCPCQMQCTWHGMCYECVSIHRYAGDRIPTCMQNLLEAKAGKLARGSKRSLTPKEYWDQLKKVAVVITKPDGPKRAQPGRPKRRLAKRP